MCGIFGCIGRIERDTAVKCVERIRHRGPDALKVQELNGATLGHARLAILDTADRSDQPMCDASGRYWIVYNGEVYNFIELRRELEAKGYQFSTETDTEVLLYAYIEWGEAFQDKCNGMWALAIWDNVEKKLFLSRDRFGIKPLFLYTSDGCFYFASEMKAFFPIMKERRINYILMDTLDCFGYEATEQCVIQGITRFPAGMCGIYHDGQMSKRRWWNTLDHIVTVPKCYEEQVEMLRELFLDACRIRMRSDVPIGTALSGGIDSSCTIGAMHYLSGESFERKNNDWQHAFLSYMPETALDEDKYATLAAGFVNVPLHRIKINPQIGVEKLLDYLYLCEDPYITSPIPYIQTYGAIRDAGIKVTLDGHGADELFGGYGFDLFAALGETEGKTADFNEIVQTYNDTTLVSCWIDNETAMKNAVPVLSENNNFKETSENYGRMDELNKCLYRETHHKVLPAILRCYDRFSMANGLEVRMPFMDYRIVCFAFSIPWKSKVREGYTKKIVRDMGAPFMDRRILNRKSKIGWNSPSIEWFKGEWREFLTDTICSRDFMECDLVNALDICVDVNEVLQMNENRYQDGERIWSKIMPYFWKKAVIDRA